MNVEHMQFQQEDHFKKDASSSLIYTSGSFQERRQFIFNLYL